MNATHGRNLYTKTEDKLEEREVRQFPISTFVLECKVWGSSLPEEGIVVIRK